MKYLISVLALFAFASTASADYPDRPVSVTVVYNPGGATDFQARIVTMMDRAIDQVRHQVQHRQPGANRQLGCRPGGIHSRQR